MPDDNPDWTKDVKVYVESPAIPAGPFEVVQDTYNDLKAKVELKPDSTIEVTQADEDALKATVTQASAARTISGNVAVIAHPTGEIETKGTGVDTTGGGTVTLAEYTVTNEKGYHICNLCVACKTAHWIFLYIGGSEKRRYYVPAAMTLIDWFAWDWNTLTGDSSKKIELKALKDNGGETLYGDFAGEEV